MLKDKQDIWTASQVVQLIREHDNLEVTNAFVASVLRNILKMRYKRVKNIPVQANSELSLVKR